MEYPVLIIFHGKHGDTYYLANKEIEYHNAFAHQYQENLAEGWYIDEDIAEYEKTYSPEKFMLSRQDYEYERVSIETPLHITRLNHIR